MTRTPQLRLRLRNRSMAPDLGLEAYSVGRSRGVTRESHGIIGYGCEGGLVRSCRKSEARPLALAGFKPWQES